MDIPLIDLVFTLESGNGMSPYALLGSRHSFPAAFRRAVGCGIDSCRAAADCPCRSNFSQELTVDPAALRRYQKPSLPFAFRFPHYAANLQPGDVEDFSLTLVGVAVNHLEHYIAAVRNVLPPQLTLLSVAAVAADGRRITLASGCGRVDTAAVPLTSFEEIGDRSLDPVAPLVMEFTTPLRLLQQSTPLRVPSFPVIAGALFRRVSSLAYYYGGVELDHDFKWLASRSREVRCRPEKLQWGSMGGSMQGCSGRFVLEGDLSEILPFLLLGEYLNLGKGAAYGMGCYSLRRV
jgi:hypothetical protein